MNITLTLTPDVEQGLMARARERGVPLEEYLLEIVKREACLCASTSSTARAENLSDLLLDSPFAGANLNLERSRDHPRTIEIE